MIISKTEEKKSKRRRKKMTAPRSLKKTCYHVYLLLWMSSRQSPSIHKLLFVFGQELLLEQRGHGVDLGSMFVQSWGCQLSLGAELVFRSGGRKTYPLNAHRFAIWHRAWKQVTQIAAAFWFVSQERLSSWDIIRDECYEQCAPRTAAL